MLVYHYELVAFVPLFTSTPPNTLPGNAPTLSDPGQSIPDGSPEALESPNDHYKIEANHPI